MEIGSIFDIGIDTLFKEGNVDFNTQFDKGNRYQFKYYFNSGRNSIQYLLKVLNFKSNEKILLPAFLCNSITQTVNYLNINCDYYGINKDLTINESDLLGKIKPEIKAILFINYFGIFPKADLIKKLKDKNIIIIEDATQSIFSEIESYGDYVLASIRKWFPIPDGAYLFSSKDLKTHNDIQVYPTYNEYFIKMLLSQLMKSEYINNNSLNKNIYLEYIHDSINSLFSDYKIRNISEITFKLLKNLDYEEIQVKRNRNFQYLYNNLRDSKQIQLFFDSKENNAPFGLPILCENRDKLREFLSSNNIYTNIHWIIDKNLADEYKSCCYLSGNILTLPCDQRYCIDDMNYIIKKINEFYK